MYTFIILARNLLHVKLSISPSIDLTTRVSLKLVNIHFYPLVSQNNVFHGSFTVLFHTLTSVKPLLVAL